MVVNQDNYSNIRLISSRFAAPHRPTSTQCRYTAGQDSSTSDLLNLYFLFVLKVPEMSGFATGSPVVWPPPSP